MAKLLVANWKSQKSLSQAQTWLKTVGELLGITTLPGITPVLTPPFPFLVPLTPMVQDLGWQLGVQDISPFPAGSYTGAVSGANLHGSPVKYAIVGHSERRHYFHETIQDVARKAEQALDVGITPIVCVDKQTLEPQAAALGEAASKCIVAYEPTGAIGSGNNAPLAEIKEFHEHVKRLFDSVPFLYGGSVDELNINEYLLVTDGVIVSTASLAAQQFVKVLKTALGNAKVT